MTIDIGPNCMWVAKMIFGLYMGWLIAQPIKAALEGVAAVKVAKINADTSVEVARIKAECDPADGGS